MKNTKYKSVRSLVDCYDVDDTVIIYENNFSLKKNDLYKVMNRTSLKHFLNKRVFVANLSNLKLALSLILLEGLAKEIIILPLEKEIEDCLNILKFTNNDLILDEKKFNEDFFMKIDEELISSQESSIDYDCCNLYRNNTIIKLPTSGTTGFPKFIDHNFCSLTKSFKFKKVNNVVWGSLYSLRRFAGLQVFLNALFCKSQIHITDQIHNINNAIMFMLASNVNALSATPSMWRKASMVDGFDKLKLKQITIGGEIVDQKTINMLDKIFPNSRITHIYASTEAGVGFSVSDKKAGFPSSFFNDSPGLFLNINESGELLVKNKNHSYVNKENDDWFNTGDVIELVNDRFFFKGRSNGSINIGGNKVMPEEIECVILELAVVSQVKVFSRSSSILGNVVECSIVPMYNNLDLNTLKKTIINHCKTRLDSFKVPVIYNFVEDLNLSPSGKMQRN